MVKLAGEPVPPLTYLRDLKARFGRTTLELRTAAMIAGIPLYEPSSTLTALPSERVGDLAGALAVLDQRKPIRVRVYAPRALVVASPQ